MRRPATGARRRVAVLGYHKIGPPAPGGWDSWFYIPERIFAAQLSHLRDGGWHFLDLDTFLHGLDAPETLPARSALLTFDDGYRSMLHTALPWLRRFGCPAVLFVPTDFIGGSNRFDAGSEPEEPICNWDELRELEAHGVAVQSHGRAHRGFSTLTAAEQEAEAHDSRRLLEDRLQRPVTLFSFPFGDPGTDPAASAALLARAGYRAACRYGGGPVELPAAQPYQLARLAMGPDSELPKLLAARTT